MMGTFPERTSLDGVETEIFKLVSHGATQEQWAEWLRAPLEHAAAQGNLDLVDKLIQAGADGSAGWRGCNGRTLLRAAASGGNEGVVSSLLRQGSRPDVNVLSPPDGPSALYEATVLGHEAAARRLILAGADVDFSDPKGESTLLDAAIHRGQERLAQELVMSGANVNARSRFAFTALHGAASSGQEGVVSALLLRGADKDAVTDQGFSALMCAARRGHLDVAKTLLAAGADFNLRSAKKAGHGPYTFSALDLAAQEDHVPIMHALLQGGVDADACDESGGTALYVAAGSGKVASIDALIEAGANLESKCSAGKTPLEGAASCGEPDALLALLRHGATLSVRNGLGMTPLHSACHHQPGGLLSVVDLLLRWNADETTLDDYGEKPSDLLERVRDDRGCSEDEIERVRVLLARAPADRAWRRRGWLVMLRARGLKAQDFSSNQQGRRKETGRSVARCEGVGDVREKASNRNGAEGDVESMELVRAVALLTELQPECVFRLIVGFLG
ncbi:unnamed protein product [Scytosiphon promiscuus]